MDAGVQKQSSRVPRHWYHRKESNLRRQTSQNCVSVLESVAWCRCGESNPGLWFERPVHWPLCYSDMSRRGGRRLDWRESNPSSLRLTGGRSTTELQSKEIPLSESNRLTRVQNGRPPRRLQREKGRAPARGPGRRRRSTSRGWHRGPEAERRAGFAPARPVWKTGMLLLHQSRRSRDQKGLGLGIRTLSRVQIASGRVGSSARASPSWPASRAERAAGAKARGSPRGKGLCPTILWHRPTAGGSMVVRTARIELAPPVWRTGMPP